MNMMVRITYNYILRNYVNYTNDWEIPALSFAETIAEYLEKLSRCC